jgi:hypothetical protein
MQEQLYGFYRRKEAAMPWHRILKIKNYIAARHSFSKEVCLHSNFGGTLLPLPSSVSVIL